MALAGRESSPVLSFVGAEYEWWDTAADPGVTYWYRLEQVGADRLSYYGSVMAGSSRVFLPLVQRNR